METKFTNGPWIKVENSSYFDIGPEDQNGYNGIGDLVCIGVLFEYEANANLIAAAPEMYEMLNDVANKLFDMGDVKSMRKIEKLLAKARGE